MFSEHLHKLILGEAVRASLIEIKALLKDSASIHILKSDSEYDLELFLKLLDSEDAKIRKNVALILGKIEEPSVVDALYKAYQREDTLFVKSAYLTGMSYYDFSQYSTSLEERKRELSEGNFDQKDVKHIAEELSVLKEMLGEEVSDLRHKFTDPATALPFILTTGKDSIACLEESVKSVEPGAVKKVVFNGILVNSKRMYDLSKIRIYKELLIPLNNMKSVEKKDIPSTINNGELISILEALHTNGRQGAFSFRLTSARLDVADIAARVQALSKGRLVNAPSNYEIEIKLLSGKDGKIGMFLKLHTLPDNRFKYRINTVGTSLAPERAALMVFMARDYLVEGAQILDPFCGVGTLLIERMKLKKANPLYGIDTFNEAIVGARENSDKAGIRINYINRDFFDFKHEYLFDEIITEMPQLEEADEFTGRFFKKSSEILKSGANIILMSREKNLIKKHLRLNDSFKLIREFTISEKENLCVYVISYM